MNDQYDDIIALPHPTSSKHLRMSAIDRAAQFSPFAALTGHDAAIRETARLVDQRVELTEEAKAELDTQIQLLMEAPGREQEVSITYFQPDKKKDGGTYVTVTGIIKKIDELQRTIVFKNGMRIPIDCVFGLENAPSQTI